MMRWRWRRMGGYLFAALWVFGGCGLDGMGWSRAVSTGAMASSYRRAAHLRPAEECDCEHGRDRTYVHLQLQPHHTHAFVRRMAAISHHTHRHRHAHPKIAWSSSRQLAVCYNDTPLQVAEEGADHRVGVRGRMAEPRLRRVVSKVVAPRRGGDEYIDYLQGWPLRARGHGGSAASVHPRTWMQAMHEDDQSYCTRTLDDAPRPSLGTYKDSLL